MIKRTIHNTINTQANNMQLQITIRFYDGKQLVIRRREGERGGGGAGQRDGDRKRKRGERGGERERDSKKERERE